VQYRTLGRTGIKVSPYALGTLMFATAIGNPDPDDSVRIIHKALDAGINLIDTADAYGDAEDFVGKALKGVAKTSSSPPRSVARWAPTPTSKGPRSPRKPGCR
jgi:aryl-alcohol dehydrogenase-like predicted oxidoreductase